MYYTYVRSHGNLFGGGSIALADRESKRTKIFKHVVHNLFGIRLGWNSRRKIGGNARKEVGKIRKRNNRFSVGGSIGRSGGERVEKLKSNHEERYLCASGEFGKLRAFLLAPPLLPLFPILQRFPG